MANQFWVRVGGKIHGPFTPGQLKQFAAARRLAAQDSVSTDQIRWTPADQVPGLTLPPAKRLSASDELGLAESEDDARATPPDYSAIPIDLPPLKAALADEEYRLSELLDEPPPVVKAKDPTVDPYAARAMARLLAPQTIIVDDSRRGILFAAAAALVIVLLGIGGGVLLTQVAPQYATIITIGVIVFVAIDVVALLALGIQYSTTSIELQTDSQGVATARISRKLLLIPVEQVETPVTPRDLLVKTPASPYSTSMFSNIDLIMLALVFLCCAIGAFPGVFFWIWYYRSRGNSAESQVVRLSLRTKAHPQPIRLIEKRCEFNATRYGDPEIAEIVDVFRRYVPGIDLHEETLG
jgi:hypothetical protein